MSFRLITSFSFLICISTTLLCAGCMLGPDYSRPQTDAQKSTGYYHSSQHSQDPNDLPESNRWWTSFGDTTTSVLVEEALANNYDLKAAAARLLQAQASLEQARGTKMPDISYNLARDRSKRSFNFGIGRISPLTTTYQQDFSVVYILDLFGKLRRAERAAWADLLATQASKQALTNSIIASVVNTRVKIATLQRSLAIAKENTESWNQTLEIVERRYSQGLVGPVDVRLARENLAASKAVEPAIEITLASNRHALDVLIARQPGSSLSLPQTLPELPNLESVPIGLPASLLDRRPDVMAAEFALEASNERIGVSIAQLFPDLTLTGMLGRSGDTWNQIFIPETEVYSAVFSLAQPIFKGGQLMAQTKSAKAKYAELAADYANTVLIAMKEVEDTLVAERMLQEQFQYTTERLVEATAAEQLSRERYQRGIESITTVLESERRRTVAEEQLITLKEQIWSNRVNLLLALGGDWTSYEEITN